MLSSEDALSALQLAMGRVPGNHSHAAVHAGPVVLQAQEVAVSGVSIKQPGTSHSCPCLEDRDAVALSKQLPRYSQPAGSGTNDSLSCWWVGCSTAQEQGACCLPSCGNVECAVCNLPTTFACLSPSWEAMEPKLIPPDQLKLLSLCSACMC